MMSDSGPLSNSAVFITADAAERTYGITRHLIKKRIAPDGWLQSGRSSQRFPIWATSTIEAYVKAQSGRGAA